MNLREVVFFTRNPLPGQVSIERVFETVSSALPAGLEQHTVRVPRAGASTKAIIANLRSIRGRDGEINHVTGDVHYLAAALDRQRTVLTIHDFVSLHRLRGFKRALFRCFWYLIPARRAAAITVISQGTKSELERWLPHLKTPVHVVPNPLHPSFMPAPKGWCSRPNFLVVGTKPNKNLERIAAALNGIDCTLTIVGKISSEQQEVLRKNDIDWRAAESVSDEELVRCYEQADALLFPSTYEGFGLPIIEAQAVGRPVITSQGSPFDEVAGNAAIFVDPGSVESIRAGVLKLIKDPGLAADLVRSGLINSKRFAAARVAQLYLNVYEDVLRRAA